MWGGVGGGWGGGGCWVFNTLKIQVNKKELLAFYRTQQTNSLRKRLI